MIRKNPITVKVVKTPKFKKVSKLVIELSPAKARSLREVLWYNVTIPEAIRQAGVSETDVGDMKETMTALGQALSFAIYNTRGVR